MTASYDQLLESLQQYGQEHVLKYWNELDELAQKQFADQIENVDLAELANLIEGKDDEIDFADLAARAELPPAVAVDGSGADWSLDDAREAGEAALRAGKIATLVVAGGQGTRLGFDKPKGMFPAGPLSDRTLFQIFADRLIATGKRYGVQVPMYLMTSEATDAATRKYFESNNYLGLDPSQVIIFQQGTMPAVDAETGKLLLASKGSLALSPDGHGGTLRALDRNGCLDKMKADGNEHLFYWQVDNPLVALCDPMFIGHHLLAKSELTSQVIRKRYPMEKVGNLVQVDGKTLVIEYSDLPDAAAEMTSPDGGLKLWAGSIAVHLFEVAFLIREKNSDSSLPFHRASKKVPHLDATGTPVKPETPNATKFEKFIFDLVPSAQRAIVVEVEPAKAFAPIKNADGAETDTPELSKKAISDLHRSWLESAGATVNDGVTVEINAKFALDEGELAGKVEKNCVIDADRYFDV
ncbi:UDP-N-acetylglucosamine/UDP-N-acetylgalactosaminediphosphorylase [Neorhodopirellula lusitana]|uniref:UDP-N-acetylglucosamine/UDP-N-acetylgalactosamine diphosphorylase n=1 Tax=Neorhodopirellula lusitana TaxID=445327 RepID=A0ABY1QHX1_9BACT|nr:UDPGP type 1 family protein [Neorhodopirellula lusitana]SMP71924.1 UDP-N-acetylglucosamine/UDP-N-acetylgalactosaminediphosphorylase [Neorhodopirellula lusitana]